MTEDALPLSLDARAIVGLTLYGEARGESLDGKLAVLNVIRNRLKLKTWGETYRAVCLARKQFSCWNAGDPNRVMLITLAPQTREPAPENRVLRECLFLALGVVTDQIVTDNTKGADHYLTRTLYAERPPAWAPQMAVTATIGNHIFLRARKPS